MTTTAKSLGAGNTPVELALEAVLQHVPHWAGKTISYAPVPGGLSNLNWCVTVDGDARTFFVKIPGEGTELFVDRKAANLAANMAHARNIGPEVIYFDAQTGVEISEFLSDHWPSTNTDFLDEEIRDTVIDIYKTFHAVEPLPLQKTIFDMIDEHFAQISEVRANMPRDFEWLRKQYGTVKAAFYSSGLDLVPCFNDPMPGNFLIGPHKQVKLVDYEFASNNERHFDLGVWFGEMFFDEDTALHLIEKYFGSARRETVARVFTMRALADLKWACWSMVQEQVSGLSFDYFKYGTWKFIRARDLMQDPRWPTWVQQI